MTRARQGGYAAFFSTVSELEIESLELTTAPPPDVMKSPNPNRPHVSEHAPACVSNSVSKERRLKLGHRLRIIVHVFLYDVDDQGMKM